MIYIQMGEAWIKGICSPYEFRKCLSEDLDFCREFEGKIKDIQKQRQDDMAHEQKIREAMALIQRK